MEHMKLHHVGIVISQEKAQRFMEKFGLETELCEYVEAYQADCIFTKRRADESYIELVVPKGGVLTRFNNGKGGIHHIAFEVEDVEKIRQAVPGAGGIIVNFLRPRFGEGILTEFVQRI